MLDEAALGEPHEARKSNANQPVEACTRCPSLARQASILTKAPSSRSVSEGLCVVSFAELQASMRGALGKIVLTSFPTPISAPTRFSAASAVLIETGASVVCRASRISGLIRVRIARDCLDRAFRGQRSNRKCAMIGGVAER